MTSATNRLQQPQKINRRRMVLALAANPIFFAVFLFLPAGTWAWKRGWLFVGVFLAMAIPAWLFLWRVNPEMIIARSHRHQGTKPWDRVVVRLFLLAMIAIDIVAALDDGRFHWFPLPWWVCAVGYALLLAGAGIVTWAQAVNKFFEPTVRIQADRDHKVIDAGPYALVRHPGYLAGSLVAVGIALCLGSLWALIPAGIAALVLILRTHWEDQTLQTELAGYKAYTERVRYRLIPGAW